MLTANEIKLFSSLKHKKFRDEYGKFLIEGFHLVEECLSSSFNLECLILRNGIDLREHRAISDKISDNSVKTESLPELSFNKLTDTKTSQGIIGVVSKPEIVPANDYGNLVIALDGINDPGNLGTIIRTAYWFNVRSIFLSPGSAEIYNSKVIRASQGAVFNVNIYEDSDLSEKLNMLQSGGYSVYLFDVNASQNLSGLSKSGKSGKSVIAFGSESSGISDDLLNQNFGRVKIDGYSDCESLNVAISCGIALYELRNLLPK